MSRREDKRTARVMKFERTARFEVDYLDGKGAQSIETATALVRLGNAYANLLLLLDGWNIGESRRTPFAEYRRIA